MQSDQNSDTDIVRLVEETLRLDKRQVSTGKVRVRTLVDKIDETVRASLDEDRVEINRVAVGEVVESAPTVRSENGVIIVPILEEVLFVEKRLVLKEELHIHRRIVTEQVEVPITLRKERAVVESLPPEQQDRDHNDDL